MNLKLIKGHNNVKAGWHIRACINHRGSHWIGVVLITGKPFMNKSKNCRWWKVSDRARHGAESFIGDLGAETNKDTGLVKFSNKAWNKLSAMSCRELWAFLNRQQPTNDQWARIQDAWKCSDRGLMRDY